MRNLLLERRDEEIALFARFVGDQVLKIGQHETCQDDVCIIAYMLGVRVEMQQEFRQDKAAELDKVLMQRPFLGKIGRAHV